MIKDIIRNNIILINQNEFFQTIKKHIKSIFTDSEYTKQAIIKYGVIRGIIKGFFRILRCNPFSNGGFDPLK